MHLDAISLANFDRLHYNLSQTIAASKFLYMNIFEFTLASKYT